MEKELESGRIHHSASNEVLAPERAFSTRCGSLKRIAVRESCGYSEMEAASLVLGRDCPKGLLGGQ
jgi:hypothetical protein